MNYLTKIIIKIYEYITCVKNSTIPQTEIEIDDLLENMEYHMIYDK